MYVAGLERAAFSEPNDFNESINDRDVDQEEMNDLFEMLRFSTKNQPRGEIVIPISTRLRARSYTAT